MEPPTSCLPSARPAAATFRSSATGQAIAPRRWPRGHSIAAVMAHHMPPTDAVSSPAAGPALNEDVASATQTVIADTSPDRPSDRCSAAVERDVRFARRQPRVTGDRPTGRRSDRPRHPGGARAGTPGRTKGPGRGHPYDAFRFVGVMAIDSSAHLPDSGTHF